MLQSTQLTPGPTAHLLFQSPPPQASLSVAEPVNGKQLGDVIGVGAPCLVSYYDGSTVLKGHEIWVHGKRVSYRSRPCEETVRREDLIYKQLGTHARILQYFGLQEVHPGVHSLRLEMAPLGNVRQYIEKNLNDPLPEQIRFQMALDVAVGLSYVHSRKVRHADLSCRNLFLFDDYRVKVGDFGGSMIEGFAHAETDCEEIRYELPCRGRKFSDRPFMKRELFALGSAIYEIMAWGRPYPKLQDGEVEE